MSYFTIYEIQEYQPLNLNLQENNALMLLPLSIRNSDSLSLIKSNIKHMQSKPCCCHRKTRVYRLMILYYDFLFMNQGLFQTLGQWWIFWGTFFKKKGIWVACTLLKKTLSPLFIDWVQLSQGYRTLQGNSLIDLKRMKD